MTRRKARPWYLVAPALIAAGVIALAVTEIGPAGSSTRTSTQVVRATNGVVQSTVTGSGNVEPGTDDQVNFATSGTLQHVYVKVGEHVNQGELLATLDPSAAQLTLDQAEESLRSARLQLTAAEQGASSLGGTSSGGTGSANGTAASTQPQNTTQFVSLERTTTTPPATKPKHPGSRTKTTPAPSPTTTTTTIPAPTTPSRQRSGQPAGTTTTTSTRSGSPSSRSAGGSGGSATTTTNPNTTAANIASAQASVYSAEANVTNAQKALDETKLYAPTSGTVVSLQNLAPGDAVSAGSNSATAASSSSGNSNSNGGAASNGSGGTTSGSSGSLGGSSSSSSSAFLEIVNTHSLTMTVPFDESDISKLKVGQSANVTLDALSEVELAAHVSAISTVATTSSSVVSYDVTLTLDQTDHRVKPGMSASAAVIVAQAHGVTVPNAAVTGAGSLGTVNVIDNGKTTQKQVILGLHGDSRTLVVSGLKAGQELVVRTTLPALGSSSSSGSPAATGSSGTLGGGGFGAPGGLGGGGGFGAARFFRGGGGGP